MIIFTLSLLMALSGYNSKAISQKEVVPVKMQKLKEVIKVYPTPDNVGSITIYSANEIPLTFYLFDLEGKLIYQSKIYKNEKKQVEGLTKGTYLYNAFQNDVNLEVGKVVLK